MGRSFSEGYPNKRGHSCQPKGLSLYKSVCCSYDFVWNLKFGGATRNVTALGIGISWLSRKKQDGGISREY